MITIQTLTSRIIGNDGSLATGTLVIAANESFEFTNTDLTRKKVTTDPISVSFVSGALTASFTIAPTLNASQDKVNLYYTARFITAYASWTEYWSIDANGGTLEITAITQVIVDAVASTTDYIGSDEVSVVPIASGIPRAGSAGTIDAGWILGIPNMTILGQYTATNFEDLPTNLGNSVLAIGYVTSEDQIHLYGGGRWR